VEVPKTTGALEVIRNDLRLDPDRQVRVIFEGDKRIPLFECCFCEDLLHWIEPRGRWECPTCTYELTPIEAEDLLDLSVRRLQIVMADVRRKQGIDGRWEERGWFSRLIRRLFGGLKKGSKEIGRSPH